MSPQTRPEYEQAAAAMFASLTISARKVVTEPALAAFSENAYARNDWQARPRVEWFPVIKWGGEDIAAGLLGGHWPHRTGKAAIAAATDEVAALAPRWNENGGNWFNACDADQTLTEQVAEMCEQFS